MKNLILLFLALSVSVSAYSSTYYDSVIDCASEKGDISKLNILVKSNDLYKKDRVKGSIEYADLSYALFHNNNMCEYANLKISLEQFKGLLGKDRSQFTFPMNLKCYSSQGAYGLSGVVSIDSSQNSASVVYLEGADVKSLQMKCESKSLLNRITDSLLPDFGS